MKLTSAVIISVQTYNVNISRWMSIHITTLQDHENKEIRH